MIRTESEYKEALRRLDAERKRLTAHRARLKEAGLSSAQVKRALAPFKSFHAQLVEDVRGYERLKEGDLGALKGLWNLGRTLVAARIALGLTQRELAKRLKVDESQVSRDERNDYHGVTVERASRILDAMGVDAQTTLRLHSVARRKIA